MSPVPAAAAAKVAADHESQKHAREESGGDDLVATDIVERSEESTTTYKDSSGFTLGAGDNHEAQIVLLLVLAAVIIFIQHDATSKSQDGTQYAAIGVVGFVLLVLAQFWPDIAFMFTILFVVSVVLNSPHGVPLIGKAKSAVSGGTGGSSDANPSVSSPTQDLSVNTRPIIVPGSKTGLKAS